MPTAMQSKITLTGTRVPAITAWPCIAAESAEIIAICSLVTVPVCRAGPRTLTRCPVTLRRGGAVEAARSGNAARLAQPGGIQLVVLPGGSGDVGGDDVGGVPVQ